ncbi:polysaccharide biosynthesis protein [Prevotella herbatica]|uniref:Polysaccharide biosynthesis protein n=1 Tax=Prevotella herbatica TaxID=2801997 RepID=A0ABN6EK37_9BACT|nr:oligosaccharide flippase family protein [Prevotella herbatica]BCS85376.1 polysaccharide biosynthesis protein [Prevotella herbatica]
MANLKSLAKDTAIYGMSSIVGRFFTYLLVPIYTAKLSAASGGYGVITNLYAYTALLLVILTYGMETTFFRYANKPNENPEKVYSTILMAVGFTSLLFIALIFLFLPQISGFMGYSDHPSYVWVMGLTVAIDSFQCIPFAYLRYKKRPIKFATLKLLFIIMTFGLNILYYIVLPALYKNHPDIIGKIYDPTVGAGYAFYINLFCTGSITFCFIKEFTGFKYVFDKALMKRMLTYSWPILILGVAGILNQTADRIIFPYIYKGSDMNTQLGIYGAASKIAMIMALITQAFRYAYEPFVFGKAKENDNRETYAKVMKYFVIFTLFAYLFVIGYMDILKHLIARDYWDGLRVVPIVMIGTMMYGIYFNLSFWYKLIDKTIWGAYFSGIGCIVLIVSNIIFVPRYGYMACAWSGITGYGTSMLISYFVGQKMYRINYPLAEMAKYLVLSIILNVGMNLSNNYIPDAGAIAVNTVLILIFGAYLVKKDFPLSRFPIIGKHFRH